MARCRSKKAENSGHSAVQGVLLRGESFYAGAWVGGIEATRKV